MDFEIEVGKRYQHKADPRYYILVRKEVPWYSSIPEFGARAFDLVYFERGREEQTGETTKINEGTVWHYYEPYVE